MGLKTCVCRMRNSILKALRKIQSLEDAFVPKARPAFVHDLGLNLRNKSTGLVREPWSASLFPFRELRIVVANEKKNIFFRLNRDLGQIG